MTSSRLSVRSRSLVLTHVSTPRAQQADPRQAAVLQRQALAAHIVARWSNHLQEVYHASPEAWAAEMAPLFERASLDTLVRAADAKTFDQMNVVLIDSTPSAAPVADAGVLGQVLGDAAADLVYVPVTPCRLFDTRVAGGAIAAAAINFTVVSPAAGGYVTYPRPLMGTVPVTIVKKLRAHGALAHVVSPAASVAHTR